MDIEFSDIFTPVSQVDYDYFSTPEYEDAIKICRSLEDVINSKSKYSIRVNLIGQRGVGKTRFIRNLVGIQEQDYEPTIGSEVTPIIVPLKYADRLENVMLNLIDGGAYHRSKYDLDTTAEISLYFLSILDRVYYESLPQLLLNDSAEVKILILTSLDQVLKTDIFATEISSLNIETFKEKSVSLLTHIGARALDLLQRLDAQQMEKLEHH